MTGLDRWQRVRLGDIITVKHGFAFPGSDFSADPQFPVLMTPGNFSIGGGFKHAKPKTYAGDIPEAFVLRSGDLVLSLTDLSKNGETLGTPALIPATGITYLHNQRVGLVQITNRERVTAEFLSYALRVASYRSYILSTASGSTVRHTSPRLISEYTLDLPPISEQMRIVDVLGSFDQKIAINLNVCKTSEKLIHELVGSAQEWIALSEAASETRTSIDPSKMNAKFINHYSLPAFDKDRSPTIDEASTIRSNKQLVANPCVLLSKLNPRIPRIWNVPTAGANSYCSTEFVVLEPRQWSTSGLWGALSHPKVLEQISALVGGTSGSHQRVKPADLMNIAIPRLDSSGQTTLDAVTAIGARIEAARSESTILSSLRDTILPSLVSGD